MYIVSVFSSFIILVCFLRGHKAYNYRIKDLTTEEFQTEVITQVNRLRKFHRAKPLRLHSEIEKHAKNWARALLEKAEKQHELMARSEPPKSEGEAVFVYHSNQLKNVTAKMAVTSWYCHRIGQERIRNRTGLYPKTVELPPLVWEEAERVGVAKLVDEENDNVAIVAHFYPVNSLKHGPIEYSHISHDKLNECKGVKRDIGLGDVLKKEEDPASDSSEYHYTHSLKGYGMPRPVFTEIPVTTTIPPPTTTTTLPPTTKTTTTQTTTTESPTSTTTAETTTRTTPTTEWTTSATITSTTPIPTTTTTRRSTPSTTTTSRPPRPDAKGLAVHNLDSDEGYR